MVVVFYCPEQNTIYEWFENDVSFIYSYKNPSKSDLAYSGPYRIGLSDFKYSLVVLDVWYDDSECSYGTRNDKRVMPFGKFKGELISVLPNNYLRWVHSIAIGPLKFWTQDEMISRFGKVLPPVVQHEPDDGFDCGMDPLWDFGDN